MNARAERNFTRAETIAAQVLQRRPDDCAVRRATARLFDEQGRAPEALPHWTALRDGDPDDFEAAYHVALGAIALGAEPTDAAAEAAPSANNVFRTNLAEALAKPAPTRAGAFTHLAICGLSYCGSTLLDRILGGLPGVKSIGESHWLAKERANDAYRDVVMSAPLADIKFVSCSVCGQACTVLSSPFRRSLAADQTGWYRKIAERLDTDILVSADKNTPKLIDKDPLLDLSALVVFKSPQQAWKSKLTKLPADRGSEYYEAECRSYIGVWTKSYRIFLDHFRPTGPVAFLNFDAFTKAPEPLLRAICETFGLMFDDSVLRRTMPGHAIGGNAGSMARLRENDYAVKIEPLADPDLDRQQADMLDGDAAMQETWREMLAHSGSLAARVPA